MKRLGNLYEKIISWDNLKLAESKARKGKQHTTGVKIFDKNLEANLRALQNILKAGHYHTSPYKVFTIHTPKERLIYNLPYYPDRIVHHAIMNVLEPIWISVLPYNTYSCVPGRGIGAARKQVVKILSNEHYNKYCLKIDIKKFYPSIRHDVIKDIYRKKIKCPKTLALLDEIVDSVNGTTDPLNLKQLVQGRSIPIGNYLSQYLSNLTLAYVIHDINKQFPSIKGVVYADDGCFFAGNKEILHELLLFIQQKLKDLGLELKSNYQIFPIAKNQYNLRNKIGDKHGRGVDFLGFVFYRDQIKLRKRIKYNLRRKVKQILPRQLSLKEFKQEICSWLGWIKYSDSKHLLKTIIPSYYYKFIYPMFKSKSKVSKTKL